MDGLKRINDELGHLIGSRAVCRFAETLRAACRTTDTAARYGGDEFVAVLSDTDLEGAKLVVRRVPERLDEDPDEPALSVSAGSRDVPARRRHADDAPERGGSGAVLGEGREGERPLAQRRRHPRVE